MHANTWYNTFLGAEEVKHNAIIFLIKKILNTETLKIFIIKW